MKPAEVTHTQVYGLWRAQLVNAVGAQSAGGAASTSATVLFERNAEFPESLSGALSRDGVRAFVAGDLEDGVLTLEESADGAAISAVWLGQVVASSCGQEIRGEIKYQGALSERARQAFVLRKVPGWQ